MKFSPFVLLCTTGLFAIFSSTVSKSPVLPLFAAHLGGDPADVGMVAAVSAFTGVIASIPAGILSDKWGRRRMLLMSAAVFSTAPFLYPFVNDIWQLAVLRFYHGFATALFIPAAMALVSDLFHKERGEKMGWFSTATLIGRFMAPIAGGSIIGALTFNPEMSFKIVYLVCGITGVTAMLLTLRLPAPLHEKRSNRGWKETLVAFKMVLSHRAILITSVTEASILFAYGTFETFLPLYAINTGLSAYEVGALISAQVITLAITKPVMGRFSDRHGRRPQISAGALIGAVCIGSFPFFKSFVALLALSMLFGLSLSVVTSATSAFIADLSSHESRGSAMGVLGSIMDIGHTTGPFVSGMIAVRFGLGISFIGSSLVLTAAALIFWIGLNRLSYGRLCCPKP